MIITSPDISENDSEMCMKNSILQIRAWSDVTSTAKSFKSWHTCMNDKACKIIVIVLIAVGSVFALWLLGSLLRMFKDGVSGICDFICWCCPRRRDATSDDYYRQKGYQMQNQNYNQGAPPPPPQPPTIIQQPVYVTSPSPALYNNRKDLHSYYDEYGTHKDDDVQIEEQEFNLNVHKNKSLKKKNKQQSQDEFITDSRQTNNGNSHDNSMSFTHTNNTTTQDSQGFSNPYEAYQNQSYQDYQQRQNNRQNYY